MYDGSHCGHGKRLRQMRVGFRIPAVLIAGGWAALVFVCSSRAAGDAAAQVFAWLYALGLELGMITSGAHYERDLVIGQKSFHVLLFAVLGLLIRRAFGSSLKPTSVALLGLVIAGGTEAAQRFFPGREPAVSDLLLNCLGFAAGVALALSSGRAQMKSASG
jgi:VanZ family protein